MAESRALSNVWSCDLQEPLLKCVSIDVISVYCVTAHRGAGHSLQNAVGNGGILYDRTLLELLPGFLSSFPRPRHCFAEALPRGVPDAELTNLIQEELVHRILS